MAEVCNVSLYLDFLIEPLVSLCAAIPNTRWVEYIPQPDALTKTGMSTVNNWAQLSDMPGQGIEWDFAALDRFVVEGSRSTLQ